MVDTFHLRLISIFINDSGVGQRTSRVLEDGKILTTADMNPDNQCIP